MLRRLGILLPLLAVLAACGDAAGGAEESNVTVLTGARLIDGNGGAPIENAVVVIRGERLESVGPAGSVTVPEGAEVIDLAGKTIMPGIINAHGHLALTRGFDNAAEHFNEANIREKLAQYARYGVLHLVSMGTDKPLIDDFRRRQDDDEGYSGLARVYTAGRGFGTGTIDGTRATGYPPLQPGAEGELDAARPQTEEEARAQVRALADRDVTFVKMWVDHHFHTLEEFPPNIYQAIVDEANALGLRPVAHIHTYEDASRLIDAGVDGIVHSVRDRPVDQALIQKFVANDVFSIATLAREESMFIYAGRTPYLDDPFFTRHHSQEIQDRLASPEFQATHINNPELHEWEPALRMAQQNLKALHDGGVKIGFGSDSGPVARWEGYFEHREMELMAEAGLTPAQIIQIASRNSAEILGIDADYGTIEPGKMAEFLILDANPLENISNTKTLEQVWQRGARVH